MPQSQPQKIAELSPEQRALRQQGLGASEVAAVLGLDPFKTALDVFLEKTGQAEPLPENRFMRWGKRLEAVIADEYQANHPDELVSETGTTVGRELWMLATPDRIVVQHVKRATPAGWDHSEGRPAQQVVPHPVAQTLAIERWGLECKSRGHYNATAWGESGTDEVPHAVAVQCHWGMAVTGLKRWDVAVLLGGNDYREYTLRADGNIAQELVTRAREFWQWYVLAKVHPPFTGAPSDHGFLLRTYPGHTSEIVTATPEVGEWANALQVARETIEAQEKEKSRLEARIKEFIADRLGVAGPFGRITWKHMDPVEVAAFTRKSHRRFNVQFTKGGD